MGIAPTRRKAGSVFDDHHPPSTDRINDCVHCGFCLPACPTYMLWREEMDSPRGRIYLMKVGLEGAAAMDPEYVGHFDKCLGCMSCVSACPSGVKYDQLIEATRAQVERNYRRPLSERFFRWLIFSLFPHPRRLRMMLPFLWMYQRLGLRWLLRRLGLLKLLPPSFQAMEALLPEVALRSMTSRMPLHIPPAGPRRMRVGLLLGCVQQVFFDDVNRATARVLAAEGCEVIVPPGQQCCGALATHAGRERESLDAARRMIDAFEAASVDAVVINAAGCGSNMKDYGRLLADDPRYARRAQALAAKCKDITEVLAQLEPRATRRPLRLRVAYHDACHLQHAQGIRLHPRQVLATIPGLEVLDIAEAAMCCGSAGIHNLVQPKTAEELGERKVRNVLATGADVVASGNPGCNLQMMGAMQRLGRSIPVLHTIELLDASIRGVLPERRGA
jgi:glycolate oxidase iron-sulfur subunit